ncbi:MAG: sigma-70 family RNA polymerase sigma factor [Sandaracinaceae bacterium]|nr:sigma-70 family RNA polymerase sigma factor [Sandaracinaceae bacterium]
MSSDHREPTWRDVWEILLEQRDLLGSVAAAAARTLGPVEANDLVHSFALEQLPRILRRTGSLDVPARDAYIRAAFRNFVRSAARTTRRQRELLNHLQHAEPPDDGHELRPTVPREDLLRALETLPTEHAQAISLFLGIEDGEQSLREIASKLEVSRYKARQLVLDGFLALAAALGIAGGLTHTELRVCDLLINHQLGIAAVAMHLSLTPHQVREALARAREVVNAQLA